MRYFNTTGQTGQVLIDFEQRAESLEKKVLKVFEKENKPMAWHEVKAILPDANEVSLKRSISNLKNRFKLEKTSELVNSIYGVPAHRYKLI